MYAAALAAVEQLVADHQALHAVVDDFTDTFDESWLADHIGKSFTCAELDALARLLIAMGRTDGAITWLECHAEGDEYGDSHYQGTDVWTDMDSDPAPTAVDLREYAVLLGA
jgi:hypothetical protein